MLDVEPSKRPSAAQILTHPWMTSPNPLSTQLVVGAKVEDVKVRFFKPKLFWQVKNFAKIQSDNFKLARPVVHSFDWSFLKSAHAFLRARDFECAR